MFIKLLLSERLANVVRSLILLTSIVFLLSGHHYTNVPAVKYRTYLGEINQQVLLQQYGNFNTSYTAYSPTLQEQVFAEKLDKKNVVVLFGTWCEYSEVAVGKLLKLIDTSNIDLVNLQLIGVDLDRQDRKGIAKYYDVKKVPTVIVLNEGDEVMRVDGASQRKVIEHIAKL